MFALEVITELRPFPSHPFPSLGAPATAPGGDWIPRQGHLATPTGTGAGGRDAPGCQGFGMRQPAKGHLCHVPMAARLVHVSPSRWRGRGGRVTAQTPPPVTLPWAHLLSSASSPQRGGRAAGSIGRKINSRLSGRRRLRPSSPLLLPRRHRAQPREAPGIAGQRTGSSSHLWQHPAGRSGRAEAGLAPGAGQGCRQRGCRAAVPAGHRQSLEAAGSSIMSGSDKGAQLGCPGQSDKGTVIFVLQEREKK